MELLTLSHWKWNPQRSFENISQIHAIPLSKTLGSSSCISQKKTKAIPMADDEPLPVPGPPHHSDLISNTEFAVLQAFQAVSLLGVSLLIFSLPGLFSVYAWFTQVPLLNVTFSMKSPTGPFKLQPDSGTFSHLLS